jgi:hypothetical protein
MLEDTPTARFVYTIIITGLVVIGLVNNVAGLMTFTRENIRITACGSYLSVFSLTSIIFMVCLQISVLTIAGYDTRSYRLWSCYANPYISLTIGFIGLWLSVGIAIERVLIECFHINLYRTRRYAILVSIGFFILSSILNLPVIFAREYASDSSGKLLCLYDYLPYPAWKQADIIFSYIYVIIPCVLHFICSVCILTTIVRRKVLIHRNTNSNQRFYHVWLQQLYIHRDCLVPSIFIILCLLPTAVHGHLLDECLPYLEQRRLRIAFTFLLYIPMIVVYLVYIYPNDCYREEFQQTWFYRKYQHLSTSIKSSTFDIFGNFNRTHLF